MVKRKFLNGGGDDSLAGARNERVFRKMAMRWKAARCTRGASIDPHGTAVWRGRAHLERLLRRESW